jgi:hypothetical protein
MHVVEPARLRDLGIDPVVEFGCGRRLRKEELHWPISRGGDSEQQVAGRAARADQERRRAAELGQRTVTEGGPPRQRPGWQKDATQGVRPDGERRYGCR